MEILTLYLVSENASKFSVLQCLQWVSFIECALWMDIWGKNLKTGRHKVKRVCFEMFEKHHKGQHGCRRDSEGTESGDEMRRAEQCHRGGAGVTVQNEDQCKDFGSYWERSQGPAFSRRVS